MKILLAEDQSMVRGALAALLSMEEGFEITQAEDGDRAWLLMKQNSKFCCLINKMKCHFKFLVFLI